MGKCSKVSTFVPHSSDDYSTAARYWICSPLAPSSLIDKWAAGTAAVEAQERRHACAKQVFAFLFTLVAVIEADVGTAGGKQAVGLQRRAREFAMEP